MTPERWQQVKEIFQAALDRAPDDRSAFLADACHRDELLRQEVESLISSHEKDGSFIDSPAYEAAAEILTTSGDSIVGQTVGHYKILSPLGKGGMGEVFLAEDSKLGRKVALKFLPTSLLSDPDRLRRFELEARAASALNQPNILTIHEIGEVDQRRFIATEYIEGETLRQRMRSGPLTVIEALGIAEQVALALGAAHAAGIIHRDIKPENIMLRGDGLVKILDFGLAKLAKQKDSGPEDAATRGFVKTSTGIVMGTVAYMSPEQARGLTVDARTDIWSLGTLLYEMIGGRPAFGGETTSDVLVSVLDRNPPSLALAVPGISETVEFIVMKALTKEREERYQTSREMLTDLRRVSQRLDRVAEFERSGAPQRTEGQDVARATSAKAAVTTLREPRSKRRMVWAALAVLLVALLSMIIWKGRAYWSLPIQPPVVILMDSTLPDRVYDAETRKNGGTNADDITDILRDLPVVIQKENTSPLWHREDQILREKPALIVIHRSCFADASLGLDPKSPAKQVADKKIESFLGYLSLGTPTTKFLTYTRNPGDQTPWLLDLEKRFPQLKGRVVALTIPGGPEHATFREPETKKLLRQQVTSILGLR